MAEEFVDLYKVLDLSVESDRNTVRKRINELYLEAQRNLDHRDFKTRVRFQELFEITLPQARYILLDEGRRDDYDRLVRASRSPEGAAAFQVPPGGTRSSGSGAVKTNPDDAMPSATPGGMPELQPLPDAEATIDPEKLARERAEMWNKWKSGLQEALAAEESGETSTSKLKPQARPTSPVRLAPDIKPDSAAQPSPAQPVTSSTAAATHTSAAPAPAKPRPTTQPTTQSVAQSAAPLHFDNFLESGESSSIEDEEQQKQRAKEQEQRRADHGRELIKDALIGVALKWMLIGAVAVIVPGISLVIYLMGRYYPRTGTAETLFGLPSAVAWLILLALVAAGAFFAARKLSEKMRQKEVLRLSRLSYEDLVRTLGS